MMITFMSLGGLSRFQENPASPGKSPISSGLTVSSICLRIKEEIVLES